jgi:citrate synthase
LRFLSILVNLDSVNVKGGRVTGDERLLTTAQVARRLQVKPETVYAYVSRGLLHSVRDGPRRQSLFDPDEVDRLAERGRDGRTPSGVVERIHTELTLLDQDELYYRGHPVADLAGTWPIEAVAHLLWTGELAAPPPFTALPALLDVARAALGALPGGIRLADRVRVAVAAAGAADPLRYDITPAAVVRRAESLLAVLVDALGPGPGAGDGPLAARLWPALTSRAATPAEVALLDLVLVVLADHDLAVSTVAARVAASARAHPYAVVSAGLGALDGPYHGAATAPAHRFLGEALDDPVRALSDRLRGGAPIPGFGHRIYRARDPRAALIHAALRDHPPAAAVVAAVDTVTAALAGRAGAFPNVDLALAAAVHALDLRPDAAEAVFALARTVGWIAHALEEYRGPGLRFRAEGVYTGRRPRRPAAPDR